MCGHGLVHLTAGIDDRWSHEAIVEIARHVDKGVIGPHVSVLSVSWCGAIIHKPFVDCTAIRRNCVANNRVCGLAGGSGKVSFVLSRIASNLGIDATYVFGYKLPLFSFE